MAKSPMANFLDYLTAMSNRSYSFWATLDSLSLSSSSSSPWRMFKHTY